jgi:hypothetical protein
VTAPKSPVRKGAIVDGTHGDIAVVPDVTEGYMRLRVTERRSAQNRNPKACELKLTPEQWDELVTEGDRILSPRRRPR